MSNKEAATRRFYTRLLRGGTAPTKGQQQAAADLGFNLEELAAEAAAGQAVEKKAAREVEKYQLRARLLAMETARAERLATGGRAAERVAKQRKLDSDLGALAPVSSS